MKIDYSDYISITDKDVIEICRDGIRHTNGFISFAECAKNFFDEHGGSGTCVGERDLSGTCPSFGFYTAPLTTHMFFLPRNKLIALFPGTSVLRRFEKMQKKICSFGYSTYDMS